MPTIFVRSGQRFNIHAEHIIDGILHPRGVFLDPARRAEFGIQQIDVDLPAEYSTDTHTLGEVEEAPYFVVTPRPQEQLDRDHNNRIDMQIRALEAGQDRCLREAALTGDKTRLQAIEDQIQVLRAQRRAVPQQQQ
jgi:hypothetical protein